MRFNVSIKTQVNIKGLINKNWNPSRLSSKSKIIGLKEKKMEINKVIKTDKYVI